MDFNYLLLGLNVLVILYFHVQLNRTNKKLKNEIEQNIQNIVENKVKDLNLIHDSDLICRHSLEILETLKLENGLTKVHIGNTYVSRCTKCGEVISKHVMASSHD